MNKTIISFAPYLAGQRDADRCPDVMTLESEVYREGLIHYWKEIEIPVQLERIGLDYLLKQ